MRSKQVIVMRKDLKMRRGKEIAQGSHASSAVILDLMRNGKIFQDAWGLHAKDEAVGSWIEKEFTKICVYVNSEQELIDVYEKAKSNGLNCSLITDSGRTEFDGVPTKTCCAIGPNWEDDINLVTKELTLY